MVTCCFDIKTQGAWRHRRLVRKRYSRDEWRWSLLRVWTLLMASKHKNKKTMEWSGFLLIYIYFIDDARFSSRIK
jgi:cell division FtsZ-interacting protein ZapD